MSVASPSVGPESCEEGRPDGPETGQGTGKSTPRDLSNVLRSEVSDFPMGSRHLVEVTHLCVLGVLRRLGGTG